ncbi:MAG TPA: hypothetical protein VGL82_21790 [Bryobacteraceae bacterium]
MKKFAVLSLLLATVAISAFARNTPPPPDAPEIDPSSISAASALVGVGLLMVRGRQKR